IVVATSARNRCLYCVVAHGAILRVRAKDPEISDILAVDWRRADLSPRQRAMLAYAEKLAMRPWEVGPEDTDALRAAGFDREAIWDIGAITALFAASNRLAHMSGLRPNPEFHRLGRRPRG
ncbi:MAG TPA: alkylhydroperoxidase, partial [Rhodospirillales bacterium]|nr:alkylhydroperoxidase [Rhodospirillales bacterium]